MMTYKSYKEIDSDRLSRIPSHWNLKRHKDLSLVNRKSLSKDTEPFYQFRYIDISNVNQQGIENDPELMEFHEAPSRARRILREKDIIISTVRTYLKAVAFIDFQPKNYIASTGFAVLSPRHVVRPQFLAFYCQSDSFIDLVVKNSKGVSYPAINATELSSLTCIYPPLSEQQAIAQYLDAKTNAIDKKVTLLEQKIDYYKELRKSLINEAVTKGLDKSVILKDSGIDWIGQIPEHWGQIRMKDLYQIDKVQVGENSSDFTLLSLTQKGVIVRDVESNEGKFPAEFNTYQIVKPEDLVFCLFDLDVTPRTVGIARHKGMITGAYTIIKNKGNGAINNYFYYLYLMADQSKKLSFMYTGLRNTIKKDRFLSMVVPFPSEEEQTKIAEFLDQKTVTIDKIIQNITNQIDQLKELRKTLINNVVTGKIRVYEPAENKVQA